MIHLLKIDPELPAGLKPFPLAPDFADFSAAFRKQMEWELTRRAIAEHGYLNSALRLEMLREDLARLEREIEQDMRGERGWKDEPSR
jgi:hypothetical protein